jgi:nickel/cobalt transporter (NicO) family protein
LLLLVTALLLGFLHGLGADHLMAIAALSVDMRVDGAPACPERSRRARRARALGVAVKFAMGHALLLTIGAGLIVGIGWSIPLRVERGGEMLGGALLVVMGLVTLQHLFVHRASHFPPSPRSGFGEASATGTSHLAPRTSHSHLPTMIGAAFAVSSLRALAMLTPFGASLGTAPLPLLVGLIAVFAVGILGSMTLFGVVLAGVLSTSALERLGQGAGALVGVSSVVLGVAWVMTA